MNNLFTDAESTEKSTSTSSSPLNFTMPTTTQIRQLIRSYFRHHSLVQVQLESFNKFFEIQLPNIIRENGLIEIYSKKEHKTHVFSIENVTIAPPTVTERDGNTVKITPADAKERQLTYSSNILITIRHVLYETDPNNCWADKKNNKNLIDDNDTVHDYGRQIETKLLHEVPLCQLPVMVGSKFCSLSQSPSDHILSKECPYDIGGYFVINGHMKTILCQEKVKNNFPMVIPDKKDPKRNFVCEVRSWNESKIRSTSTLKMRLSVEKGSDSPSITISLPFIHYDIPLPWMFRLIGVESAQEMKQYIVEQNNPVIEFLAQNVLDDDRINTPLTDIYNIIATKANLSAKTKEARATTIQLVVFNEFLPHMGLNRTTKTSKRKAEFLGYMVRKTLRVYTGQQEPDNRDHYANKRLETPGMLLALLFRQHLRIVMRDFQSKLMNAINSGKYTDCRDMLSKKKITSAFKFAMATGKWGMQKGGNTQTGVAQMLTKTQPLSIISHLRRINTPIARESKTPKPRMLDKSHWGIICVCETPEGKGCGLLKNLALMTHVRVGFPSKIIEDFIVESGHLLDLQDCKNNDFITGVKVFLNGRYLGVTHKPKLLREYLCTYRQSQDIPFDTSISQHKDELIVETDAGCCSRPVFVLKNMHKFEKIYKRYVGTPYLWNQMIYNGILQYLDKSEESEFRVAAQLSDVKQELSTQQHMSSDPFVYSEIHPSNILGVLASMIPLPERNQAPRNIYQTSMGKQALGIPGLNYKNTWDSKFHVLDYPQKPAVTTDAADVLQVDDLPAGQNPVVAIACYTGFNQEDSVLLNQAAIDRGLFRSTCYQTYKESEKKTGTDREVFCKPDEDSVVRMVNANYDKLDPNTGIIRIGERVNNGDALVGKVMITSALDKKSKQDTVQHDKSMILHSNESAIVDNVLITQGSQKANAKYVKVRTRISKIPQIGDKFCLTGDHEVLTLRGWVPISKITFKHSIATLNPSTHKLEYHKPTDYYQYETDESDILIEIKNNRVSIKSTPNHKMYVQSHDKSPFKLEPVDTFIFNSRRMSNMVKWECKELYHDAILPRTFPGTRTHAKALKWLRIVGWCLCRPHCLTDKDHSYPNNMASDLKISREHLWEMIIREQLCRGKTPAWLKILSRDQCRSLILGAAENGSIVEPFRTFNKTADELQIICMYAGWSCDVSRDPTDSKMSFVQFYYLDAHKLYPRIEVDDYSMITSLYHEAYNDNTISTNIKDICDTKDVSAYASNDRIKNKYMNVYCIEVPNHIFMVRRHGLCVWTGNSSRHGQKGVCGMILPEEDMPYTSDGIKPDLVINPNCIPSRMTLAHIIEMFLGKTATLSGRRGDGTAFQQVCIDEITKTLHDLGYERFGNERMYNGMTGEMMDGNIFIGPIFYQRLKHIALEKMHARRRGRVQILTRQPNEGRSREGGLRCGEMEKDAIVAHGAAHVLQDRMCLQSDAFETIVCSNCGYIAEHRSKINQQYDYIVRGGGGGGDDDDDNKIHDNSDVNSQSDVLGYCRYCDSSDYIRNITIPYAFKLLIQELGSCHLGLKMHFKTKNNLN